MTVEADRLEYLLVHGVAVLSGSLGLRKQLDKAMRYLGKHRAMVEDGAPAWLNLLRLLSDRVHSAECGGYVYSVLFVHQENSTVLETHMVNDFVDVVFRDALSVAPGGRCRSVRLSNVVCWK